MLTQGLSIIVPTKDRDNVFFKTLDALYEATSSVLSEIIIINDSKTNTIRIPPSYEDRVKVFDNPKSGVASARNYGVKQAKYLHLLFLDDDIILTPNSIHQLNQTISANPNVAINFNWVYPKELLTQIKETQFGRYLISHRFTSLEGWSNNLKWDSTKIFELDLVASYFLYIFKADFVSIGGYNELFPHAGAEDFEFAKRLKQSNIKGLCNPLYMVFHNEEDRIDLLPWLQRKERAAETRKIAVELGNPEMRIHTTLFKRVIVNMIYRFKSVLFLMLKLIPNKNSFDRYYSFIVNKLLLAYLYKGYFKN